MQIYEDYDLFSYPYNYSLRNVLLADVVKEFAAQDALPGFGQHPNHAMHKTLDCKEPVEIHQFEFEGESQPWIIRIYDNLDALIGQAGDEYKFYDNIGIFVDEHIRRVSEGGKGEDTFNAFAKKYACDIWLLSLLSEFCNVEP